jgi:hypothetical protein
MANIDKQPFLYSTLWRTDPINIPIQTNPRPIETNNPNIDHHIKLSNPPNPNLIIAEKFATQSVQSAPEICHIQTLVNLYLRVYGVILHKEAVQFKSPDLLFARC